VYPARSGDRFEIADREARDERLERDLDGHVLALRPRPQAGLLDRLALREDVFNEVGMAVGKCAPIKYSAESVNASRKALSPSPPVNRRGRWGG
jgi:hypothetical protein